MNYALVIDNGPKNLFNTYMIFFITCWEAWGDTRSVGYNASGNINIIEVELEADSESEILNKLQEKKILTVNGRNRYRVHKIKI